MREILYKGKIIECALTTAYPEMVGEWYEGFYYQDLFNGNINHILYSCPNTFLIDKKTLSQYIGIVDKEGNKIFEGDIVQFYLEPVELSFASSADLFGTEPQCSWQECTEATAAIRCIAEVFYDKEHCCFSLRNLHAIILDEDTDEDYELADPEYKSGGANGFEITLNEKYDNLYDFCVDSLLNVSWPDYKYLKIISNIYNEN